MIACIQEVQTPTTISDFRSFGTQFHNNILKYDTIPSFQSHSCYWWQSYHPMSRYTSTTGETASLKKLKSSHTPITRSFTRLAWRWWTESSLMIPIHTGYFQTALNISSKTCTVWCTTYDTATATCFGTEMPSSGSHYNKCTSLSMAPRCRNM